MIEIKNVSKNFMSGNIVTKALSNINLTIKEGEFVAIMGPSGSGKSTLLNLISGLDTPLEGEILVDKKNLNLLSDNELSKYRNSRIGFIFQEFYLEPSLTVKENVTIPTYFNHKSKKDDLKAEKLIKEVSLTNKINSKAKDLSGGEKQRVAIARALINNPQILIADEPTGNLDTLNGEIIIELLKDLHKNHKVTLIIATHDNKIAASAKRIIHIKDGQIC